MKNIFTGRAIILAAFLFLSLSAVLFAAYGSSESSREDTGDCHSCPGGAGEMPWDALSRRIVSVAVIR